MKTRLTKSEIQKILNFEKKKAENLMDEPDRLEEFLKKLEKKLATVPTVGGVLADIPVLISLVRVYLKKEYRKIPFGSIISIVCALLYFFSPVDLLPDVLPVIGYLDDVAVIAFVINMIHDDLDEYREWRDKVVSLDKTDFEIKD